MDRTVELALEIGIITRHEITPQMEFKLREFRQACIDDNENSVPVDHFPNIMLEDEHRKIVENLSDDNRQEIERLQDQMEALSKKLIDKENYIYQLKNRR